LVEPSKLVIVKSGSRTEEAASSLVPCARSLAWSGAATILEIWGIKIGPILAGLELFGVAVALGAQDLFKNLISGILVIAEKRFNPGDWIRVDGEVEGAGTAFAFPGRSIYMETVAGEKPEVFVPPG
jgi:MscS family membrane protein